MSRLSKLYNAMDTLRSEGLVDSELERKVSEAEEEIIKNEILPILKERMEPALQQVQRELIFVVDYKPGLPLTVSISRMQNFTANLFDFKEISIDPEVEHTIGSSHQGKTSRKCPRGNLTIKFPNGMIIKEKTAVKTLETFVKTVGVDIVRSIVEKKNLKFCRVPVISNRLDPKYKKTQLNLGNGWFLITHSNNRMKKDFIKVISEELNLNLEVY